MSKTDAIETLQEAYDEIINEHGEENAREALFAFHESVAKEHGQQLAVYEFGGGGGAD